MTFPNLFKKWSSCHKSYSRPRTKFRAGAKMSPCPGLDGLTRFSVLILREYPTIGWVLPPTLQQSKSRRWILTKPNGDFLGLLQASGRSQTILLWYFVVTLYSTNLWQLLLLSILQFFKFPPPAVGSWLYWNGWCFCCQHKVLGQDHSFNQKPFAMWPISRFYGTMNLFPNLHFLGTHAFPFHFCRSICHIPNRHQPPSGSADRLLIRRDEAKAFVWEELL